MTQEKKEEIMLALLYTVCMAALFAILYALTGLEILEALFGGLIATATIISLLCLAFRTVAIRRRERKRRQLEEARKRAERFRIYDLEGKLVETPIPGSDLVEIRSVVTNARERKLELPPYMRGGTA